MILTMQWIELTCRALIGAACFAAGAHASADTTTYVADHIIAPNGTIMNDMAIVVEGGAIRQVMPVALVGTDDVVRFPEGAFISPGMIDVGSSLAVGRQNVERYQPIDPQLRVVDSIDPTDPDLEDALEGGVTAAMIMPGTNNIVGGRCATIRTHVADATCDVIRDDGPMMMSFGPSTYDFSRGPASRSGALFALREALDRAQDGNGGSSLAPLAAGEIDALINCDETVDATSALRTMNEYGISGVLLIDVHSAVEIASELAEYETNAVLGPLSLASDRKALAGPAALEQAGVEVAFRGNAAGNPRRLRVTAALAVRSGMSPEAARRAITSNAAEFAGVADRIGALKAGLDADFVVFSGDPLRLDSRVLEVYSGGERVLTAKQKNNDEFEDWNDS